MDNEVRRLDRLIEQDLLVLRYHRNALPVSGLRLIRSHPLSACGVALLAGWFTEKLTRRLNIKPSLVDRLI
ncbi:MAG: hypothetical protein KDI29_14985 [Pseudomonadales bacterium]|nr:hypothetical protein [Pseudomonadales bacterium]